MRQINPTISISGYQLSDYNFFQTYENGETVVFNTLYRSLIVFDQPEMERMCAGMASDSEIKELIDNHILVSDDLNELETYKKACIEAYNHSDVLSLAIMPTLSCNCACPYCFERKTSAKMTPETEADILSWIDNQLQNYKLLSVDWFGGEPLLHQEIIKRMSLHLMNKCRQLGVLYFAAITTNGVLMNRPEVIAMFKECSINNVQITFDGGRHAHDSQKFLSGGNGTYARLLSNAHLFCSLNPDLKLRVRVNVSDTNYMTIGNLLDDLTTLKNNIVIFFRWVYANSTNNWIEYSQKEKGSNPYKGIYDLQMESIRRGFTVDDQFDKLQFRFAHCEADSQGFFTIDPLGNLYTCVHEFNPKFAVGNVRNGLTQEKLTDYLKFREVNVFDDQECRQCRLLPMCNGGCRRYRVNHGKHLCIDEKQSIELYVDMLYHKLLNQ